MRPCIGSIVTVFGNPYRQTQPLGQATVLSSGRQMSNLINPATDLQITVWLVSVQLLDSGDIIETLVSMPNDWLGVGHCGSPYSTKAGPSPPASGCTDLFECFQQEGVTDVESERVVTAGT